jgi:hypothetical protein
MTRADYDPSTGTIRADLATDARPAVHAGPEGRSVVLHLTHTEAVHLKDQLVQAIRRAERATQVRSWPAWPASPRIEGQGQGQPRR